MNPNTTYATIFRVLKSPQGFYFSTGTFSFKINLKPKPLKNILPALHYFIYWIDHESMDIIMAIYGIICSETPCYYKVPFP